MSIHQTDADYWALKEKGQRLAKRTRLICIGIFLLLLWLAYEAHPAPPDPQIAKVVVWRETGNPRDSHEALPVPNAQVTLFHGDVDPETATHSLWSAPTDADGKIIAGVRDGTYTVSVEVDGKRYRNLNGKVTIEVKGDNALVKYIIPKD